MPRSLAMATVAASCVAALAPAASGVVYFDGVFNDPDWSLTTITNASGAGSSVGAFQVSTGGNPNEYRRIRHALTVGPLGNGVLIGLHLRAAATYDPAVQGAVTSIDYSEDSIAFAGPGSVQISGLHVLQGGRTYIQRNPLLTMPLPAFATWTANPAPGLLAADLHEVDGFGNINAFSNPDFSAAGGVMQFGFYRGNSNNGTVITDAGIDNWRVEIIPAPGAAAVLLALGGVSAARRRRR